MDELTDKEKIYNAAKGNFILFGSRRELRRLKLYLNKGEEVFQIITGSRAGLRGRGIVVATNERVIFIWDGWVFRETQDFPYETVSSVEFRTGILFGTFSMYGKGDEVAYNWVGRVSGANFAKTVRELVSKSTNNPPLSRPDSAPKSPVAKPIPENILIPSEDVINITPSEPHAPKATSNRIDDDANIPAHGSLNLDEESKQKLAELKDLRDRGILTNDEYFFKRQQIVDKA